MGQEGDSNTNNKMSSIFFVTTRLTFSFSGTQQASVIDPDYPCGMEAALWNWTELFVTSDPKFSLLNNKFIK